MKKITFSGIVFSLLTLIAFSSCNNDPVIDVISYVKKLKQPTDNKRIEIQTTSGLTFEWEEAEPKSNQAVIYEIVFDKTSGDFSNPVYSSLSAKEGAETKIAFTKNELDKIAEAGGAKLGEEVTLKWAVQAKSGNNVTLSEEERKAIFVRASTIPEPPEIIENLFMAGEGSEAGQQFKKIENSSQPVYEIYTKIEGNKAYYFSSQTDGSGRTFSLTGTNLEETTNASSPGVTLNETGTYRLKLNLDTQTGSIEKIEKVMIRVSMTGRERRLEYTGQGIWKIENYNIQLTKESWGIEERYKLIFIVDGKEEHWGQLGPVFGNRPSLSQEGYRNMAITKTEQWGDTQFKFPMELCDIDNLSQYYTDITVSMSADKNYTHDFINYYFFEEKDVKFRNAIFTEFSFPDPDVIRGEDGYFYAYATEHSRTDPNMKNAPILRSANLVDWERVGSIFTDETHPNITNMPNGAGIWAPTVSKVGSKYMIYYSQPADNFKHAIGVASCDSPAGPFDDHGKLIDSNEQGVDISIDAYLYQENGKNYLFWGSFREISVIELTEDGLRIKEGAKRKKVAGGQYEAAYVLKRDGYYYLILSTGDYSKGGTYRLVVGRSQNIMGPYVNKAGKDMIDVNHELMLKGSDEFSSPGHCSRIITDDVGNEWILYHAYPNDKDYRCMLLDRVEWEEGWPVVNTTQPSGKAYVAPVFNK